MAVFVYYYKTPDDARHEGEIEARDRDAAFAALRARGIRAIKVEPRGWETGKGYRGVKTRSAVAIALACAVLGVAAAVLAMRAWRGGGAMTSAGRAGEAASSRIAVPLERQRIVGDRMRVEDFPTNLFGSASEIHLARFAEPGRPLPSPLDGVPSEAEFRASLKAPIRILSNDYTEHVDLKRIVAGMKREASAYLAGGGTVSSYFAELVKRQKMEIAYREKAEAHLAELLKADEREAESGQEGERRTSPPRPDSRQAAAYAYWLKANAALHAMGIYPLELPEALRTYQLSLDLDSDDVPGIRF